jgi:hypothetical protein
VAAVKELKILLPQKHPATVARSPTIRKPTASPIRTVRTFALLQASHMNEPHEKLKALFQRIPRRHTTDNVKEIYGILDAYEDVLKEMEADSRYEKQVAPFFEALDPIRATVKKSNDPKASKKTKDVLFDEASGALKDSMEEAMQL